MTALISLEVIFFYISLVEAQARVHIHTSQPKCVHVLQIWLVEGRFLNESTVFFASFKNFSDRTLSYKIYVKNVFIF